MGGRWDRPKTGAQAAVSLNKTTGGNARRKVVGGQSVVVGARVYPDESCVAVRALSLDVANLSLGPIDSGGRTNVQRLLELREETKWGDVWPAGHGLPESS